jgi:hypothetical protein
VNQQTRTIARLLIGAIAIAALAGCASSPVTSTALAAVPTLNPATLPRPRSAAEQALRDYYTRNTNRPISDYQEVGIIDEIPTRLVLFTYRVADRRADTANADGSPHWEAVVGSGVARLDARGVVSTLRVGEDGEELRIKHGVVVYSLLPSVPDATAPATVAGIVWNTTASLELRAAKTVALSVQGRSTPAVFVWGGPQATIRCGFQIAVDGQVKRTVDRSWMPNGDGTFRLNKACIGVAPFYHQATATQ